MRVRRYCVPRDWAHSGEPATDEWGLLPGADGAHAFPDAPAPGGEAWAACSGPWRGRGDVAMRTCAE